ncbi:MAG: hypothetical protein RBR70_12105 [Arcobacter sp.]|jgi:hypothetical protein|uniref:hypothetical protein n=1 Tax=Arcobacter sp. TaxID=1872629 RepID=UPI0019BCEADB|nr:hypothetical protein [Arcobacter sp.]MBD3830981.1 hypothetical protein [Arcobacter sp.]MDD3008701.1 hypothetical protein [Arcobacter sp.]MDY3205804.1 hypothetical protein [Arcobacter sp.]
MGYADKLKLNSSKIKTDEKVLEENSKKKISGRPKKAVEEVRNTAIPVALNQKEKDWIEEQALKMSKEVGVKITTSAWMRMTLLKDMPEN